jgi:tetratricopeptide (TPR) repeat protein
MRNSVSLCTAVLTLGLLLPAPATAQEPPPSSATTIEKPKAILIQIPSPDAITITPEAQKAASQAYNDAVNFFNKSKLQDAEAAFTKALEYRKNNYAAAFYGRGLVRAKRGNYDAAIADLTECIKWKKDFADAHIERGMAYFKTDKPHEALADLDKAKELKGQAETISLCRGRILHRLGRRDEAIAEYRSVLATMPPDSSASKRAKELLAEMGVPL